MNNIYTGIDVGTDSVKIVVVEKIKNSFNLLASSVTPTTHIHHGEVTNVRGLSKDIRDGLNDIEDMLGLKIDKAISCLNPIDLHMDIVHGSVEVEDPNNISGVDISNLLNETISSIDFGEQELVTSTPINFVVDGVKKVYDPKGIAGKTLESKIVISSINKSSMYKMLEAIKLAGVDSVDVCFKSTGDYYTIQNEGYDKEVGAVINIGEDSTNVAIFNKGIQIKNNVINVGSVHVDRDISYMFNCNNDVARGVKEEFAYAFADDADENEEMTIKDREGADKVLKQEGVSKVVEARVREILKLSYDEIKNLTNRKISYIIITGGLSERNGMDHLVEIYFNGLCKVCKINVMGIRHNKYSSALGSCIYFDDKLTLRGKSYNMVNSEKFNNIISTEGMSTNDGFVSKMFGRFFDV